MQQHDPYHTDQTISETAHRQVGAERPGRQISQTGPGRPPYGLLWGRINSTTPPGNPPDERYYLDEVRPAGVDGNGHLTWETVPNGRTDILAHNAAEADQETHLVPLNTVVQLRQELDQSAPPQWRHTFYYSGGPVTRTARIISYDGDNPLPHYTIQPVRMTQSGFQDEGGEITDVVNYGEIQEDEHGYLAGPTGQTRYVLMLSEGGEHYIVHHPPRMP